jgi:hypothetical protein
MHECDYCGAKSEDESEFSVVHVFKDLDYKAKKPTNGDIVNTWMFCLPCVDEACNHLEPGLTDGSMGENSWIESDEFYEWLEGPKQEAIEEAKEKLAEVTKPREELKKRKAEQDFADSETPAKKKVKKYRACPGCVAKGRDLPSGIPETDLCGECHKATIDFICKKCHKTKPVSDYDFLNCRKCDKAILADNGPVIDLSNN